MRPGAGWIEVIAGPMFSGKSEELIRLLKRAAIARQRVQVFKPKLDNRYSDGDIVSHSQMRIPCELSHSQMRIPCELVERTDEILPRLDPRTEVVGDYRGIPFGPMPTLLAVAEEVHKIHAICTSCGAPAAYTQRLVQSDELVVVGAAGAYEARCRRCHEPDGAPPASEPWLFPPGGPVAEEDG